MEPTPTVAPLPARMATTGISASGSVVASAASTDPVTLSLIPTRLPIHSTPVVNSSPPATNRTSEPAKTTAWFQGGSSRTVSVEYVSFGKTTVGCSVSMRLSDVAELVVPVGTVVRPMASLRRRSLKRKQLTFLVGGVGTFARRGTTARMSQV
jgi:hypothetical protein